MFYLMKLQNCSHRRHDGKHISSTYAVTYTGQNTNQYTELSCTLQYTLYIYLLDVQPVLLASGLSVYVVSGM